MVLDAESVRMHVYSAYMAHSIIHHKIAEKPVTDELADRLHEAAHQASMVAAQAAVRANNRVRDAVNEADQAVMRVDALREFVRSEASSVIARTDHELMQRLTELLNGPITEED